MLDIQFTPKIKITSDAHNYMICRPSKNNKTGKTDWVPYKFLSSFENLVEVLLESEIRASDAKTLKELLQAVQGAEKRCMVAIRASGGH